MTDTAQIITSYGRRYIVRTAQGRTLTPPPVKNALISPAAIMCALSRLTMSKW